MKQKGRNSLHQRQESEANSFAIGLLAPRSLMNQALQVDPDLKQVQELRDRLNVSLEAFVRRYVALHDEPLAAVWSHKGSIRYSARQPRFPWITGEKGQRLNPETPAARAIRNGARGFTQMMPTQPLAWTKRPDLELFEQTRVGRDGHAVTLLWATLEEGDGEYSRAREQ